MLEWVREFCFASRRRHTRWPRDWSSDVCSSDLNWTEWLVYQFAKYVGYKQVGFTNDSRYDTLILVNESININSFDELIIHIIKTEYDSRRYHEEELAHFLEARKLINNPKSLPRVIYESEYFKFDSFGFFEIRR